MPFLNMYGQIFWSLVHFMLSYHVTVCQMKIHVLLLIAMKACHFPETNVRGETHKEQS